MSGGIACCGSRRRSEVPRSCGRAARAARRQHPGGLLALADRVGRALAGRGVAPNEPVHVSHRQSAVRSRCFARRLAGRRGRGAGSRLGRPSTVERVQRVIPRAIFNRRRPARRPRPLGAARSRAVCATLRWSSSPRAAPENPKASSLDIGVSPTSSRFSIAFENPIRTTSCCLPLQLTFIFGLWVSLLDLDARARGSCWCRSSPARR